MLSKLAMAKQQL